MTPAEHSSWIIPAVEAGFKHIPELALTWDKIYSYLFGKSSLIVITGLPGVGKSVLFEHLTGEAYERGHEPPEQPSMTKDQGKIVERKKRITLITIPGQQRAPRFDAMDELLKKSQPITCLIHVVANGFAKVRSAPAQASLVAQAKLETLAEYRAFQLQQETDDLRNTCDFALRAIREHKKPIWMLVAATKCDLYADTIKAAEQYYSPYGKNPFTEELIKLQAVAGSSQFSWDSIPVCAELVDFTWNQETVPSTLKVSQRDKLVLGLLRRIESACAAS